MKLVAWLVSNRLVSLEALSRPVQNPNRVPVEDVQSCLEREYGSFFAPLEPEYYLPDVTFEDPLSSLAGIDNYRGNVDM